MKGNFPAYYNDGNYRPGGKCLVIERGHGEWIGGTIRELRMRGES